MVKVKYFSKIQAQMNINQILAPTSSVEEKQKQEVKYHQSMIRYLTSTPSTKKHQEKRQATRTKKQFEQITKELQRKLQARKEAREKALKTYVVHAILDSNTPFGEGQKPTRKYKDLDYFTRITYPRIHSQST
jgi:predicted RNA-binding protein with RPS1 domain